MQKLSTLLFLFTIFSSGSSQEHEENLHHQSRGYKWPTDPKVLAKLDRWQDLKFGMIIHWGLYAVPGIIESWELCSEPWINRPDSLTYCEYKEWYWGLKEEFNPVNFNPEQWAKAAKEAGMKYLVFTTKHHDGFNMFETRQTDYKITSGPFASHPRANVSKYVFEAFRNEGLMIGAYYSKPDWHSQDFWWDKFATPDRNANYDIRKYPERWNRYKTYVYNQINELTSDYGRIDILWLDGGWVRPKETVNEEVLSWGAPIPEWDQNIDIPKIGKMARKNQPGLLIVDRTVHGPYENYQTPERLIPDHQIDNPWESCIPLANNWGFVPKDEFKSATKIVHSLIEIVSKGGSLLLGIGPKPDGTLRKKDLESLAQIGQWMNQNGKAIYETRITKYYQDRNTFFTKGKNGALYALVKIEEGGEMPEKVSWRRNSPQKGTSIKLLSNGEKVKWTRQGDTVTIAIPGSFIKTHKTYAALAFEFIPESEN